MEERLEDAKVALMQSEYTVQMYSHILRRTTENAEKVHAKVIAKAAILKEAEREQESCRLQQQVIKQGLKNKAIQHESLKEKAKSLDKKHGHRMESLEKALEAKTLQIQLDDENSKRRKSIAARAQGDMSQHEEEKLKRLYVVRNIYSHVIDTKTTDSESHLQSLQRAFDSVKSATGLTDINAIVDRIVTREDNQEELRHTVIRLRSKIDDLSTDNTDCMQMLHQVQATGLAVTGNKEIYQEFDRYDEKLKEAKLQLMNAKDHRDTLNILLDQCRACIQKVSHRLDFAAATQAGSAGMTFGTNEKTTKSAVAGAGGGQSLSMQFDGLPDEFSRLDLKLGKMIKQVQVDLDQGGVVLPAVDGGLIMPVVTDDRDSSSGDAALDTEVGTMQQGHHHHSASTLGTQDVAPSGSSAPSAVTIGSSQLNSLLNATTMISAPGEIPGNVRVPSYKLLVTNRLQMEASTFQLTDGSNRCAINERQHNSRS